MSQKDENILAGDIPVSINFDRTVMGKASSRRLENGDVELVVLLRKEHADEILELIKTKNYDPIGLSFAYLGPVRKKEQ